MPESFFWLMISRVKAHRHICVYIVDCVKDKKPTCHPCVIDLAKNLISPGHSQNSHPTLKLLRERNGITAGWRLFVACMSNIKCNNIGGDCSSSMVALVRQSLGVRGVNVALETGHGEEMSFFNQNQAKLIWPGIGVIYKAGYHAGLLLIVTCITFIVSIIL